MSVDTPEELKGPQAAGQVVAVIDHGPWVVCTADASISAHAGHTLVIRDGAPLVLTA